MYGSEQVGQQGPWYQWKSQGGSAAEEDEIGREQRVGMSSGLACTGSRIGLTIPGSGSKCGSEVQDSGPYGDESLPCVINEAEEDDHGNGTKVWRLRVPCDKP